MAAGNDRLESMVAELGARVDALQALLDEARRGLDVMMRGQGICRGCGGRDILHAE